MKSQPNYLQFFFVVVIIVNIVVVFFIVFVAAHIGFSYCPENSN